MASSSWSGAVSLATRCTGMPCLLTRNCTVRKMQQRNTTFTKFQVIVPGSTDLRYSKIPLLAAQQRLEAGRQSWYVPWSVRRRTRLAHRAWRAVYIALRKKREGNIVVFLHVGLNDRVWIGLLRSELIARKSHHLHINRYNKTAYHKARTVVCLIQLLELGIILRE